MLKRLKSTVKKLAFKVARVDMFDYYHCKEAMRIVNCMQEHNGAKLTPPLKKLADDYAKDVFGDKKYAPWLYVYSLMHGQFKVGWIPDNFYGRYVYPKLNRELSVVGEFKSFTNVIFQTETLPDIAYCIDGFFYDRNMHIISLQQLKEIIESTGDKAIFKRDYSLRGNGVAKLAAHEIDENKIKAFGNCVIQSAIHQHPFFDEFKTGSVATVRITTVKEPNGEINMRNSNLRFGLKNTEWVKSTHRILVPIINKEGEFDTIGLDNDWKKYHAHPDTNASFAGRKIPHFKLAVETCIRLHKQVPHLGIIGWDIIVDKDEKIKLMEWNTGHSGITFNEATVGPCFIGLNWERLKA